MILMRTSSLFGVVAERYAVEVFPFIVYFLIRFLSVLYKSALIQVRLFEYVKSIILEGN